VAGRWRDSQAVLRESQAVLRDSQAVLRDSQAVCEGQSAGDSLRGRADLTVHLTRLDGVPLFWGETGTRRGLTGRLSGERGARQGASLGREGRDRVPLWGERGETGCLSGERGARQGASLGREGRDRVPLWGERGETGCLSGERGARRVRGGTSLGVLDGCGARRVHRRVRLSR
jgi:hypothetical protein